jgi:hypothetical protein
MAAADRLPNQTPENQVFTMASSVEAIGSYSGSQGLQWTTGYDPAGSPASYVYIASQAEIGLSDEEYNEFHQNLINRGGSDNGRATGFDTWYISVLSVPVSALGAVAIPSKDDQTFQEYGQELTGDGPTEVLPVIPGHGGLHAGILDPTEVRATTAYSEMTETNGGYVSETKTFDPDTRNKAVGLFNVESTKTFTYATDANTGSIAQTAEMIATDNMGAPTPTADVIACPFGPSQSEIYPSFCNVVYAKSMSQGVTSAAQSSSAQVRMVAASADTPAELNYNFDVKPDASAGVGYAMGTFGTEFGVSIKEGRGNGSAPSATLVYTDKATVSGMVAKLSKQYASKSGFSL